MPVTRHNILYKSKKTTFIAGSAGQPAYAGQPYLPARCVQEKTSYVTATGSATSYTFVPVPVSVAGSPAIGRRLEGSMTASGGQPSGYTKVIDRRTPVHDGAGNIVGFVTASGGQPSGYTTVTTTSTVCYPEQPYIAPRDAIQPVASQTLINLQLGWNAGARSIKSMPASGRIEFMSPQQTSGAVVGLNQTDSDSGYATIDKAWYLAGGVARIYEDGVEKMYVGPYLTDDLFTIERMFGVVQYKQNGTVVYTSETLFTDPVFMDVSLYAADDSIYNPAIYDYGIASGNKLQPLASLGSDMEPASGGNLAMPMLTATSRVAVRCSGSMAMFDALGSDHTSGEGAYSLPMFVVEGQGGMPMPSYARSEVGMIPLSSGSAGTTGEIGGGTVSLAAFDGLSSDYAYGEISMMLQPLSSHGFAYEGNNRASIWSPLVVYNHWYAPFQTFVVWNEDMTVATLISASKLVNAEMGEELSVAASMTTSELLNVIMNSFVQAGFSVPVFNSANNVWVVSEKGQSSRYEGYEFNSFSKLGSRYYGMKADGLYLLEGEDDAGAPIQASIGLGMMDFGTSALKRIANCYIGLSSSGTAFLKVIANGEEYLYAARSDDPYMATQRVDIGKGIRANYMTFELYNSNGCDFELNSVEFAAVALNRRI